MKSLIVLSTLIFSFSSFAGWVETVECQLSRGNVDTGVVTQSVSKGVLKMAGPHNGETGRLVLKSPMLPAYSIVFEKVSSGRTDESTLTTSMGKTVFAKSSVDDQQSPTVENKFVTLNGDFQVSISCASK